MKPPRRFLRVFLWGAVVVVLVALIGAGILTNVTLRSVEKNLPNTLLEQLHAVALLVEDLAAVVSSVELTKAMPRSDNFLRLRNQVAVAGDAVIKLRDTYVFDNLIQASAIHAVIAPALADARLWLTEGVSGFGPETDITIDIVLLRLSKALEKARDLNHASEIKAREILNEQRHRLDQFLVSVNLLFAVAGAITFTMVLLLIFQHTLQRREFEAQAERRRAEEALRESEATLKSIFRVAPIGIGLVLDRTLKQVNDRVCEMVGYSREELVGESARILYASEEEFERVGRVKYAQIRERGTGTIETLWKKRDGTPIDVLLSSTPLDPTDPSAGVTFTALDITARKHAQEALTESQERFRKLAELLPETIYEMDADGKLTFVNRNAFDHFGYDQEDFDRGINGFELVAPEDRARALKNAARIMSGEQIGLTEYRLLRKDGSTFPAIMHSTAKVVDGKSVGLRGVVIDMTETKKLESQLRQAHKMEAVGTLAGGIAHDFNNLLQAVQGYAELLLLKKTEAEPDYQILMEISRAARRGGELTRQLLAFSRKVESRLQPLDLNRTVNEVRLLLERTIPKMIRIDLHLMGNLHWIKADPSQVEQIMMNLAVNARDAMPEGGTLTIETRNVIVTEEDCSSQPELTPGSHVLLTVSDTGLGIEKTTLEHIFDPFFTTKEVGKGTGLGLAMVYGIVKNHRGAILCSSDPGAGTAFKIYFPAIERPEVTPRIVPAATEPPRGSETILLVDDDDAVRELGEETLQMFGYTVITAPDGASALHIYGKERDHIDLIILDLIMPEMGGTQCLQELLGMDPQARVIIASGCAVAREIEQVTKSGAKAFINKPYDIQQMLTAVRRVLG